MRKNVGRVTKIIAMCLVIIIVIINTGDVKISAATREATVKEAKVRGFKELEFDSSFYENATVSNSKYSMTIGTIKSKQHLGILKKNSNKVTYVNLDKKIRKSFGFNASVDMSLYDIRYMGKEFVILGYYRLGLEDKKEFFAINTKTGSKFEMTALPELNDDLYSELFKCGKNYVWMSSVTQYKKTRTQKSGDIVKTYGKASFYTSKNMKKWIKQTTEEKLLSKKQGLKSISYAEYSLSLDSFSAQGINFTLFTDKNGKTIKKGTYHTSDFKKYKKLKETIKKSDITYTSTFKSDIKGRYMFMDEFYKNNKSQGMTYPNYTGFYLKYATPTGSIKTIYKADKNAPRVEALIEDGANKLTMFAERKDGYKIITITNKGAVREYNTELDLYSLSSSNDLKVTSEKYGIQVMRYDDKLLVSDDNFVTSFRISTPLRSIDRFFVNNNRLVIEGTKGLFMERDTQYTIPMRKLVDACYQ